jgi:hypothetical protein
MQDEKKVRIFKFGDGVIKQIEDTVKFAYSVLTTRWLEDILSVYEREILQTLSEIHTRL